MPPKRKSLSIDEQLAKIVELAHQVGAGEAADQILAAVQASNLLDDEAKKAKLAKSFCLYTWEDVMQTWGFDIETATDPRSAFDHVSLDILHLPQATQEELFKRGWQTLDVYQDVSRQDNEEAGVRTLESYVSLIVGLWYGRLNNTPETKILGGAEGSTEGACEYEVRSSKGNLGLMLEVKQVINGGKLNKPLAQLMCEVSAAYSENIRVRKNGAPVFGILTDKRTFIVISYDGTKWSWYDEIVISSARTGWLTGMIHVSNIIFTLLMRAYLASLQAFAQKSRDRADGDYSTPSFPGLKGQLPRPPSPTGSATGSTSDLAPARKKTSGPRPSLGAWEDATELAEQALPLLMVRADDGIDPEALNLRFVQGIAKLAESVACLPRMNMGGTDFTDEPKIADIAKSRVGLYFASGCDKTSSVPP
ncbi:hypothetical protein RQP46_005834 [Phenoliferia psychrophenolica]